jgi:hypothetical protein
MSFDQDPEFHVWVLFPRAEDKETDQMDQVLELPPLKDCPHPQDEVCREAPSRLSSQHL